MNNSQTAAEQLDKLGKRLQEVIESRKSLENHYDRDVTTLTHFISRLSAACRGMDDELDHRLNKLRAELQKKPDIELVAPLFDDISLLLQQQGFKLQQQLRSTQEGVLSAGKSLQQLKGLSKEQRDELRALINSADGPSASLNKYLPLLLQLLGLYERVQTSNQTNKITVTGDAIAPKASAGSNAELDDTREELINLLSVVDFNGTAANAIQAVRQQLITGCSQRELLNYCMQIIRLIVKSISEERKSAQSFLAELNDALGSVHKVISESLKDNNSANLAKNKVTASLQQSVSKLSSSVENASHLDQLKTEVKQHVGEILLAIEKRQKLDTDEHLKLETNLKDLQKRLQEMEKEAAGYKKKLAEQKFKSLQDALTRLPNRTAFEERLELEYKRWQRYGTDLTIAVADIDHFKRINDNYGHIAGDKTLQVIANMLQKALRDTDFVCRFGGEEFVIIFPQTTLSQVQEPLEIARKKIKQIPFKFRNEDISISISIGAAGFTEKSDTTLSVFERADRALYKAKEQGRDVVVLDEQS